MPLLTFLALLLCPALLPLILIKRRRRAQRELRDARLKIIAVIGAHKIRPAHHSRRCRHINITLILIMRPRQQPRLLADDAAAADFPCAVVAVRYRPSARQKAKGRIAEVFYADMISEPMGIAARQCFGQPLLRQVFAAHANRRAQGIDLADFARRKLHHSIIIPG